MSDMPSYRLAHDARKGTATMTIEPKPAPEPHNEILDLPDKTGRTTQGGIDVNPNAKTGAKPVTIPTHPGEFARSKKYTEVTKT